MNFQKIIEDAFTGLEAAIVLIAFVIVASVFAYVILGAGTTTTQKAEQTIHTGIQQATSAVQPSGAVSIKANDASSAVSDITFYLQLTAGGTGADMSGFSYTVSSPGGISSFTNQEVNYTWVKEVTVGGNGHGDHTGLLTPGEMVLVTITKDFDSAVMGTSTKFIVEAKPSIGAAIPITGTVPDALRAGTWYTVY
jgi:archaeal flagellin FlaB